MVCKRGVLIVAVVPPPVHGQSVLGKALIEHAFSDVEVGRVKVNSSFELKEVGKASFKKAVGVFGIITHILKLRITQKYNVLYYTAGSGSWVPFIRDFLILSFCRPFFQKTLIHYHSGNVPEFYNSNVFRRFLASFVYGRGAWSIRLGKGCPVPDERVGVEKVVDVANGIKLPEELPVKSKSETFRILFLGNLYEDKGILDLIDAVGLIPLSDKHRMTLRLVGDFPTKLMKSKVERALAELPSEVTIEGPEAVYGDAKWQILADSDVLVLPSYYSMENAPLVIIEAMASGCPVIATHWRGIPSLVEEGVTGFLVEPRDVRTLADKIACLLNNSQLAANMGVAAKEKYKRSHTLDIHLQEMSKLFESAVLID